MTVQAAVQTAAQIAIAQLMNDGEVPEVYLDKVCVTVNLRRFYPEDFQDHMHHTVTYFAPLNFDTRVTSEWKTDFWALTTDTANLLQRNLGLEAVNFLKMFRLVGLLNKAGFSVVDMLKNSFGRYETNITFTNLGNCNHLSNRKSLVKVAGRYGSSSEHVAGSLFANNLMTVGGKLFWTIAYSEHITHRGSAQLYADNIKAVLKAVLK